MPCRYRLIINLLQKETSMLLFSTILDIKDTLTKDEFIKLVIEWNQNTPHPENAIKGIEWDGSHNVRYGNTDMWLEIQEYRNGNTIAVRYEKVEIDGAIWDTDYVMNFDSRKMAIQLDRSFRADAQMKDLQFSTPYFITLLIEKGFIQDDESIPILKSPFMITDSNIDILASVINGTGHFAYPIIYISKNRDGSEPINASKLATRLKGVAHILVQEDSGTNAKIRAACENKNEYFGAIGIYYPNGTTYHQRVFSRAISGFDDELSEKIYRRVLQYSNSQNVEILLTWMGVNNALFRDRWSSRGYELIEAERAKKNAEDAREEAVREKNVSESLVEMTDEEIAGFKRQIESLTHDNERLLAENAGLRAKVNSIDAAPIILAGNENDFFIGEIKDIVLSVLSEELVRMGGENVKSRRADILRDILNSNEYERILEKKAESLKASFKGYTTMSSTLRRYLVDMGFTISEEGKHYRLKYYGDPRYHTTISKTASDHREGTNISTQIIRDMF